MRNWIPYSLNKVADEWRANWVFLGSHLFREPFHEESIRICRRQPQGSVVTPLDYLGIACNELPTVPPTAFIFHVSRCGSTLLTQFLSLKEENIVVSEAPIFDAILRWKYTEPAMPTEQRHKYLEHAIHLLGQKRFENQHHYFIKWDSWHLFFLDEIRAIYPATPFIFMTRNAGDILQSQQKMPGMQAVPGLLEPAMLGETLEEVMEMQPMHYFENLLFRLFSATYEYMDKDKNSILLKYEDGPLHNYKKCLDFLCLHPSEQNIGMVVNRLKYHSKKPSEQFTTAA